MTGVLVGVLAFVAVVLAVPRHPELGVLASAEIAQTEPAAERALLRRWRLPCAVLAGLVGPTVLGGPLGWALAPAGAGVVWWAAGRIRDPALVKAERRAARELPHLVMLTAAALAAGTAPARALTLAAAALPGPAADRVLPVLSRLDVGAPPIAVWETLARDPVLGPLGRTLARAAETGAPVADAVAALAADLADGARAEVEDRARSVGVRAALPLGLCLLPSFILLGIVPVVAALMTTLAS